MHIVLSEPMQYESSSFSNIKKNILEVDWIYKYRFCIKNVRPLVNMEN